MAIIRIHHNKDNPYVTLNKKPLEDENLSWGAKGLWSYLMSRPDNWTVSVSHLKKIYASKGGGEKAILSLLNELIEEGYCERIQERKDKGFFSKTEYIIKEFKNISPQRLQRHAGQAFAGKVPPNKYISKISNEEKQQQKVCDAAVAFYKCLEEIGLSKKEQQSLMKYPEEDVKRAVEFATHPSVTINTTLIKTIMWAMKAKPDIPEKVDEEENKKHARLAEVILTSEMWHIDILDKKVNFYSKSPGCVIVHSLSYDEEDFKNKIDKLLKELKFTKYVDQC